MPETLKGTLAGLGLSQYLGAFLDQGFDSWETILDITESDLDALGVKLGHRRKLQRRIAEARGISPNAVLPTPTRSTVDETKGDSNQSNHGDNCHEVVVKKRKYRRHPKPDKNAPERPPSAYVLFSNKTREDLKGQHLSFTEIAKIVGENWQIISQQEREQYERRAQHSKERYCRELAKYKETPEYSRYCQYLDDFKMKQQENQARDVGKPPRSRGARSHRGSTSSVAAMGGGSSISGESNRHGAWSKAHSLNGTEASSRRTESIGSADSFADFQTEAMVYSRAGHMNLERVAPSDTSESSHASRTDTALNPSGRPEVGGSVKYQTLPPLSDVFDDGICSGRPSTSPDLGGFGLYTSQGSCQFSDAGGNRSMGVFNNGGLSSVRYERSAAVGSSSSCGSVYGMSGSAKEASLPIQSLLSGT